MSEPDEDITLAFDLGGEDVSFSVNNERRTIAGLLVPWNAVATDNSGMGKWRFKRDSLWWTDTARVKLNTHHDHKETIAYATHLQSTPSGVYGKFKIARGDEGDRALSQAQDGVLDAFSVEVDPTDAKWEFDRAEKSVRNVTRARLVAAALVPVPAFDDARVELIAASAQKGVVMGNEENPVAPEDDAAAAKFDAAITALAERQAASQEAFLAQFGEGFTETLTAAARTAVENIGSPQEGPQPVNAARFNTLNEAPVYRFDGGGDGYSIVRDAWDAWESKGTQKGDEASDRLRKFRLQSADMADVMGNYLRFAPQTTSTASQIIPPGYRPDLYVTELTKGRPMISAASRGTISDATPFTVPTFTSSTTASATHVEGTNPSDGSISLGLRTVTPQGISGRMVVTRELVDSSNPAIDQIAFGTMRESYARQTETAFYTNLNGTNGAGGTITTDNVPSGAQASTTAKGTDNQTLVKHIRERLAKYSFQRFLFPTVATMGQAATILLANAVDTTQRPLFPWTDGQNAPGAGDTAQGGYQVDSLRFLPTWANTGVAAGDSQILIWNSADIYVWESPLLSFRFEEKQGPANIELNIFGYFATHILRPVGLSGIRIT